MENQSVTLNHSLNHAKGIITGVHFQMSPLMEFVLAVCIIQGHYFI
jgi:dTDP-4-dehydrorhamnose 3,5-epimerase-like enzyme